MLGIKLLIWLGILTLSAVTILGAFNIEKFFRLSFAKDPRKAKRLALVELSLAKKLSNKVNQPLVFEACSDIVNKYLEKFTQAHDSIETYSKRERVETVGENGLHVYKLVFRLVTLFANVDRELSCKQHIQNIIDQEFSAATLPKPVEDDLNESLMGILRSQYVYGFNATSQLRFGVLGDVDTKTELDFEECLELARKAISIKMNALAYQWLAGASQMETSLEEQRELEKVWQTLAFQTGLNCTEGIHKQLQGVVQSEFPGLSKYSRYSSCRGEPGGEGEYETLEHELVCYYHRTGWYYAVNPVKTEMISRDPLILEFHEFISDDTINYLKKGGGNDRFREMAGNGEGLTPEWLEFMEEYGETLTSVDLELSYLYGKEVDHPPQLKYLDKRMEALSGLVIDTHDTQMMLYAALAGYYDIHHDSTYGSRLHNEETGDRIGNFYIFLNDVKMGGNLAFPPIGVHIKPKRGNAVLWYNCHRNGYPDLRNFHLGCPVVWGYKQIIRMAVYQHDNVWTLPCLLDENK